MREIIIIISIIVISFTLHGQNGEKTIDQQRFEDILDVYYDKEYDSAFVLYERFLIDYPNSPLYPRAKYNIGCLLKKTNNDSLAIITFKEIIKSNYDELEAYGGLMEQYTLYKHRSSKHLSEIYLNKKDFKNAKKYIRFFDKKFKYKHFCGNELSANEIYTSYAYAKYYHGIGNSDKAIKLLTPHLFYNGLTGNKYILDFMEEILEELHSSNELIQLFSESQNTLALNKDGIAFIEFYGLKVKVNSDSLFTLDNLDIDSYMDLTGIQKFQKVIYTHQLFKKYK